jgi:hypothetical protein
MYAARMAHPLVHLAGAWSGPARTWLDPSAEPEVSSWRGVIEPLLDGFYVRLRYDGECCGKPHTGEMTLGLNKSEHTMYWIDSFHTGATAMWSVGPAGPAISVLGSYLGGDQRWGWRTSFREAEGQLVIEATNIAPDGKEYPAVEVRLSRA